MEENFKDTVEKYVNTIDNLSMKTHTPIKDSIRISGTGEQIHERGSIIDRLAQNDEEAKVIQRTESTRKLEPTVEKINITSNEEEQIDDDIACRLMDDIIDSKMFRD